MCRMDKDETHSIHNMSRNVATLFQGKTSCAPSPIICVSVICYDPPVFVHYDYCYQVQVVRSCGKMWIGGLVFHKEDLRHKTLCRSPEHYQCHTPVLVLLPHVLNNAQVQYLL